MFDVDLDDLSTADLLAAAAEYAQDQEHAAVGILRTTLAFADRNAVVEWPGREPLPGYERLRVYGGEGCPGVAEFAPVELGAVLGLSSGAASSLLGEALALRHRLPRVWAAVLSGNAIAWRARKIAHACLSLSLEAAAIVDRRVAGIVNTVTPGRLKRIVTAAIWQADPAQAQADAEAAAKTRGVFITQSDPADDHGTKRIFIRAASGDVIRFDATIDDLAHALKALGDPDPLDQRRAKAIGWIADPTAAHNLLQAARHLARTHDHAGTTHKHTTPSSPTTHPQRPNNNPAPYDASTPPDPPDTPTPHSQTKAERPTLDQQTTAPHLHAPDNPRDVDDPHDVGDLRDVHDPEDVREARDLHDPGDVREVGDVGEVGDLLDAGDVRDVRNPGDVRDLDYLHDPGDSCDLHETTVVDDLDHARSSSGLDRGDAFTRLALADTLEARLAAIKHDAYSNNPATPTSRRNRHTLYVHLTDKTLSTGTGVLRVENLGPQLATQLTELLGHDQITVKPVIDLHDQISVHSYEIPDRIRERVRLRHPVDMFPYGTAEATPRMDQDHITPYSRALTPAHPTQNHPAPAITYQEDTSQQDTTPTHLNPIDSTSRSACVAPPHPTSHPSRTRPPGPTRPPSRTGPAGPAGPAGQTGQTGQTSVDNLIPQGRLHHRAKTFGGWRNRRLPSGGIEWTSPHGFTFLVDHTGTHPVSLGQPSTNDLNDPADREPTG
ncbi:DUF222 domain-containing protein [Kribbella sp. WER1]